jgi:uncharacterized protein YdhG (YjbR/CyaY superfamily)
MRTDPLSHKSIDEYIAGFPADVQAILGQIRSTIREAAPDAVETIKYQMPTFVLNGNLVYFAAWKEHIGFYPPVSGDDALEKEVSIYEGEKGALRFPLDEPIPFELIRRIVKLRVEQNSERAEAKGKKK